MAETVTVFDEAKRELAEGIHDFTTDTLKLALITDAVIPAAGDTTPRFADYTEVSGTGYPAGGVTLSYSWNEAAGTVTFDFTDVTFSENGAGPTDCYYGLVYNDSATNKEALASFPLDGGAALSLQTADIEIQVNASGLFTLQ